MTSKTRPTLLRHLRDGTDPLTSNALKLARAMGVPLDWLADDGQGWPPPASPDEQIVRTVRQALAPYGGPEDLGDEEREVLAEFRQLDRPARAAAIKTLRTIRDLATPGPAESEGEPSGLAGAADAALRRTRKRLG